MLGQDRGDDATRADQEAAATRSPLDENAMDGVSAMRRNAERERPPRSGTVEVSHKEKVQWRLARYLTLLLASTILIAAAMLASTKWTGVSPEDITVMFAPLFTALVALVGSAVGFYYGSERRDEDHHAK